MLLDWLQCYQLSLALYLAKHFDLLIVSCKTILMLRSDLLLETCMRLRSELLLDVRPEFLLGACKSLLRLRSDLLLGFSLDAKSVP